MSTKAKIESAHGCRPALNLLAALLFSGGSLFAQSVPVTAPVEPAGEPAASQGVIQIGRIAHPKITESSGVAASRQFPGTFWTHNDGGGQKRQILYAITRTGESIAEFHLVDVFLHDWEDIAIDDTRHLYVGDIGNNDSKRTSLVVYQIEEPNPKSGNGLAHVQASWRLLFPKQPFDCESLFVWKGYGYVVSKVFKDAKAEVYRFPLTEQKEGVILEWVAKTNIDSPVTGADISADGSLLALVAKSGAFVYRINGDLSRLQKSNRYHKRFEDKHIEGCCFVPEGLLCTSESREIFLFTDPRFRSN